MIVSVDEGSCCGRHSWSRRNAIVIVCRNVHHHDERSCPRVCAQECEREPLLSAVWSDWHCRIDKRATTKYVHVWESTSTYSTCICASMQHTPELH